MLANKHPENAQRLQVLHSFDVLDTGPEQTYDDITALTAELCDAPVCLVSLVEKDRQWFKSEVGLGICETNIEQSICSHAVEQDSYLEIEDTVLDARTVDNTLCQGDKPFRFYAGAILRTLDGWPLGTLCVLDYKPRSLNPLQQRVIKVHAKSVIQQLELTRALVMQSKHIEAGMIKFPAPPVQSDVYEKVKTRFDTLTSREKEIVNVIAGRAGSSSSKEIARVLEISPRTVDNHRASIMRKMDVKSVAELLAVCLKAGIL